MRILAALVALAACADRDAGPPLDDQWKKVVELSRPRVPAGDPTLLAHAMDSIQPRRDRLRDALADARATGQLPPLLAEDAANLEALASWYRERGGLPKRTCADLADGGLRGMAAVTLADLALVTAPPEARPARAEAVLYLAHRFREEGVNLLDVTIGSEIADDAIRWAAENGVAPTAAFRKFAPTPHLLARALAAEAQCMVELSRQPGAVRLARAELDGLRRFYLSAIAAVERDDGDDAVVRRLRELTEKAHADRGFPTLKVLVPALGNSAERLLEQRRRYHAFLGGIR